MTRTLAAIACLAFLSACTAPDGEDLRAQSAAAPPTLGSDEADVAAPAQLVFGQLADTKGAVVVGASVCLLASDRCVTADADGTFELPSVGRGFSDVLQVRAEGFVPLAVPLELRAGDSRYLDLEMVPDKDGRAEARHGMVRIVSWRQFGNQRRADEVAAWRLDQDPTERITAGKGAEVTFRGVSRGLWEASYVAAGEAAICSLAAGWYGESNNSIALPVFDGHITHVERTCMVIDLH
ncbi:MAG: carboxypeptidase regulatory-like domain-containing protein [Deltaproteobacteria bacterium]|nr:carboxypeptidase regulatory-like domain-containing protein [Deltaproteobacteria bacterium]